MSIVDEFKTALLAEDEAVSASIELLPSRLARAAAVVLPADGVGISLIADDTFRVPLGASDVQAQTAERLQFTLGQGPCLKAATDRSMVRYNAQGLAQRWPLFHRELTARTPFRAITSVPLHNRTSFPGAIDVYFIEPEAIRQPEHQAINAISAAITDALVAPLHPGPTVPVSVWLNAPAATARTSIWVAIGMLNAYLDLNNADALAELRGYAWAQGSSVDDVAHQLAAGTLPLRVFNN